MTTPNAPFKLHETHVDDDMQLLSEMLEEVMAYSGDKTDQKYVELKTRAQQALDDVKTGARRPTPTILQSGRR